MTHPIAGAHPPPGRPREEALLDGLTPEQTQAVQHGPGPLLLIAGPGAGKTKTLIHRIARLLATGAAHVGLVVDGVALGAAEHAGVLSEHSRADGVKRGGGDAARGLFAE